MVRAIRKLMPPAAAATAALLLVSAGLRPPAERFDLDGFSRLPVVFEGRRKPVDTFARNLLTLLSGRASVRAEGKGSGKDGGRLSAVAWLLETIAGVPEAADRRVFRISHPGLLAELGLPERPGFRYSYRELEPVLDRLEWAARTAAARPPEERDLFDRQALKAADRVWLYENTRDAFADPARLSPSRRRTVLARCACPAENPMPLAVPPAAGEAAWRPLAIAGNAPPGTPAAFWREMLSARRAGDAERFNRAVAAYRRLLRAHPDWSEKLDFEVFFNRFSPFLKAGMLYLLAFLLVMAGRLLRRPGFLSAARALMFIGFALHTFALAARMYLSGYPPVTNLYSSVVFVGWAAVPAGWLLERRLRGRIAGTGLAASAVIGFASLLVARFLAGDGDTLERMRAVLNTRFWLTSHVITIALGYSASLLAGTIAGFHLLGTAVPFRPLGPEDERELHRVTRSVTAFALFFTVLGTVLGGLWADDSWGRFWGWDPKENGALLLVLWQAVTLHAPAARLCGVRGFARLAVIGNIVTAWSWFGVNQLGVGLHSYGFTDAASRGIWLFVGLQAAVLAIGSLPRPRRSREGKGEATS